MSPDVRALRGHGSQMAVRFEVEDRHIPIDVRLAQDACQHLSLHLAFRRHRILEQANQCIPHMNPVYNNSVVCGAASDVRAIQPKLSNRSESFRNVLKEDGLTRSISGLFADVCKCDWIQFSCLGGREGGCGRQQLMLSTECDKHIRYLTLILFDFGVADSVKGNQPGNKIFLRGRTIPLVM